MGFRMSFEEKRTEVSYSCFNFYRIHKIQKPILFVAQLNHGLNKHG